MRGGRERREIKKSSIVVLDYNETLWLRPGCPSAALGTPFDFLSSVVVAPMRSVDHERSFEQSEKRSRMVPKEGLARSSLASGSLPVCMRSARLSDCYRQDGQGQAGVHSAMRRCRGNLHYPILMRSWWGWRPRSRTHFVRSQRGRDLNF